MNTVFFFFFDNSVYSTKKSRMNTIQKIRKEKILKRPRGISKWIHKIFFRLVSNKRDYPISCWVGLSIDISNYKMNTRLWPLILTIYIYIWMMWRLEKSSSCWIIWLSDFFFSNFFLKKYSPWIHQVSTSNISCALVILFEYKRRKILETTP